MDTWLGWERVCEWQAFNSLVMFLTEMFTQGMFASVNLTKWFPSPATSVCLKAHHLHPYLLS